MMKRLTASVVPLARSAGVCLGLAPVPAEKPEDPAAELRQAGLERFVGDMVGKKGHATDARWRAVVQLARDATARASEVGEAKFLAPDLDPTKLKEVVECPKEGREDARVLATGAGGTCLHLTGCVVVSSGSLNYVTAISNSIVIVTGDIGGCTTIEDSVIICTGEVGEITGIRRCVILCPGRLGEANSIEDSFVEAAGGVGKALWSRRSVYVNLARSPDRGSKNDVCVATEKGPLTLVPLKPKKAEAPKPE
jgi:hypothetical protein